MLSLVPMPRSVIEHPGSFRWESKNPIRPHHLRGLIAAQPSSRWTLEGGQVVEFVENPEIATEGYRLSVGETRIQIETSDLNGRLYAIETLSQLVEEDRIGCVTIEDSPRFAWRGMMLDPSRHFVPKAFVLKFIDLLRMHKMNSLHLHLCDDQGWRIEITKYPRLTEIGSKRSATQLRPGDETTDGVPHAGFYTQDDLRDIVRYAAEQGINVVPEIELPGHCQAALAAYPQLGNTGNQLEPSTRFGVIEDVYGVQPETIQFLEDVLTEVLDIFPSKFIHIGGDEVPKAQWKANPVAQAKIKAEGLANEDELQSWFIRHFDRWLSERGRRLVGWDEILEGGLAPGATVMSWRGFEGGIAAAKMGHDVVMAPTGFCYFDHYQSQFKSREPVAIGGFLPLERVYEFEPVPPELDAEAAKHVLGGQGQLWSEYLRDSDQVEYMALPRLCALSEVLWGKPEEATFEDFEARLRGHLVRLDSSNYRFRPLQPQIPAGYTRIGGWAVGDVGLDPYEVRCMVPADFDSESPFSIVVQYGGGAYGVWIDRIEIKSPSGGSIVEPLGSTGNFDERNAAHFEGLAGPVEVTVTIRSKGSGELERNTSGDIYGVSPAPPT